MPSAAAIIAENKGFDYGTTDIGNTEILNIPISSSKALSLQIVDRDLYAKTQLQDFITEDEIYQAMPININTPSLAIKKRTPRYIDNRIPEIYNAAFLSFCHTNIKDYWIYKIVASFLVFALGAFDLFFKQYLMLAFLFALVGIWPDVKNKKPVFNGAMQRVTLQMLYLLLIATGKILTDFIGLRFTFQYGCREAMIVFFGLTNVIGIFFFAKEAGVSIPKFWTLLLETFRK